MRSDFAALVDEAVAEEIAAEFQYNHFITEYPDEFLEKFCIDEDTGARLKLVDDQRIVLRAMSARDQNGLFIYDTWLYSSTKKSGKTTVGAGTALWQAWRIPHGEIYIIGNDLRQADNRMAQTIRFTIQNNPKMARHAEIVRYTVRLSNGTMIYSIPVDPEGEAGMNPSGLFWTEAWGARHEKHERLWVEAALSPQRVGQSFKFIESYAGYRNESVVLERLYESIWKQGSIHSTDNLLGGHGELRERGSAIAWWCKRKLLPAQRGGRGRRYYDGERLRLPDMEYLRQHENEWANASQAFIDIAAWDLCQGDIPPPEGNEIQVLALDAAVKHDCFAAVAVSRRDDMIYERAVKIWYPPENGKIDLGAVEEWILAYIEHHAVGPIVYDPHQMEYMAERLSKIHWVEEFDQGRHRLKADKALQDRIVQQGIRHSGDLILRKHIQDAAAKIDREEGKLRLIKSGENARIDGAVALSMACDVALELNIG